MRKTSEKAETVFFIIIIIKSKQHENKAEKAKNPGEDCTGSDAGEIKLEKQDSDKKYEQNYV